MRHLFVPACLCLMASAGSIGSESILSPQDFAVVSTIGTKVPADSSPAGGASSTHEKSRADSWLALPDAAVTGAIPVGDPVPLPPVAKPVVQRSREEICDTLVKAAQSNNVPAAFFIRLLFQESAFQPGIVSSAGAQGIAQFMPETAAGMGLDNPFDPLPAIEASARLLRNLAQQFGNLGLAAAAYNAGPKRIQDWLAKKGKLPQETRGYVKTITGRPAERWTVAEAGSPTVKLPRHAPCQEAAGLLAWDGPEQIPLPPTRTPLNAAEPAPPAKRVAAIAMRAQVAVARRTAATINPKKPVKASATRDTKSGKGAVQLAASKQKHKQLQLSQR